MEGNPFEIDQSALANEEEADEKTRREAQALLAELDGIEGEASDAKGGNGGIGDASNLGQGVDGLVPLCVQHHVKSAPQVNQAVFGYDIQTMETRPWAKPDANLQDYFNYGFNEQSWRVYCAMHKEGQNSVLVQAEDFAVVSYNKITGGAGPGHQGYSGVNVVMPNSGPAGGMFDGAGGNGPVTVVMPKDHIGYQSSGGVLAQPGDASGRALGVHAPLPSLRKTKPCYAFRSGRCDKGENCNYAHGDAELRSSGPAVVMPPNAGGGGGGQGLMAPPVPPVMPTPPMPPTGYKAFGGGGSDGALFDEPPTKRPRYQ